MLVRGTQNPTGDWLGLEEAQQLARVSRSTLYNLRKAGVIKTSNVKRPGKTRGRRLYSKSSIIAFIEGGVA
jgi:hypothetical protein